MQDRRRQFDEIFLQRTAGPYIWVKRRNTRSEHIWSALPLKADSSRTLLEVRFAPTAEVAAAAYSIKSLMPRDGTARHSGSPALRRPSI